MDPQVCFAEFCAAVEDGDWEAAYARAAGYRAWMAQDGFGARDAWGDRVSYLDPEQNRYGIGPQPPSGCIVQIEKFRRACRENVA